MSEPALRALVACATVLAYAALCGAIYGRQRRRRSASARTAAAFAGTDAGQATLVLFASQTGQAEALAWQTARWLHAGGQPVRVMPLNEVDAELLRDTRSALFIASTCGEGDAPDGAGLFAERMRGTTPDLSGLRYGLLALGDRQYAQFCAFGRLLDDWLRSAGATPGFERIEVDNAEPAALAAWQAQCGGGARAVPDEAAAQSVAMPWRLAARELLNAGSAGTPVYLLGFAAPPRHTPAWQSGDIAQITVASEPGRPRDYSIASIPGDGQLQLLVRQAQHSDGTLGAASGLLTSTLDIGDTLTLRLRPQRGFRLEDNARRPLILIGNGTGLAGLRSHLRARAARREHDNWLVFGERQARHDFLCREEIEAWRRTGVLRRLDMVFSRDQQERRYVQHRLLQAQEEIRTWIARGAAIYVCGSRHGMAAGVDAALRQIAGEAVIGELFASGRYRRDVY